MFVMVVYSRQTFTLYASGSKPEIILYTITESDWTQWAFFVWLKMIIKISDETVRTMHKTTDEKDR